MDVISRIKQLREKANLSSSQLGKLAGISQPNMSKLENGVRIPDIPILEKICSALGITLKDFFDDGIDVVPLTPELRQLLDTVKELNTEQLQSLNGFLTSIRTVKKTLPNGKQLRYTQGPGGRELTEEEELALSEYFNEQYNKKNKL